MPVPFPARILIADDHPIVRRGLKSLINAEPDLTVVAEAADGAEAVAYAGDVDLAILDIAMPRLTGLQAAHRISHDHPQVRILLLSMYDRAQYLHEAIAAGAAGYVLKQQADRDLIGACRAALRHERFIQPHTDPEAATRTGEPPPALTDREREIVKLIAEGLATQQIADTLVLSPKTIERHRANILDKLGLHKNVDVTRYAIREGLVEP